MYGIKNSSGVFNAQYALVGNMGKSLVTHRNPANGYLWADDIVNKDKTIGRWVPPEMVKFV